MQLPYVLVQGQFTVLLHTSTAQSTPQCERTSFNTFGDVENIECSHSISREFTG